MKRLNPKTIPWESDPSIPPSDGSCPIEQLPYDVIYKIFVTSGQSVQDLIRFCLVNQKFHKACENEYIWRKLYFVKVVKTPGLSDMNESTAARYINDVLMKTPEGVQWACQKQFAELPLKRSINTGEKDVQVPFTSSSFVLLIAFAWLYQVLYETDVIGEIVQHRIIRWLKPGNRKIRSASHMLMQMGTEPGKLGLILDVSDDHVQTVLDGGITKVVEEDQANTTDVVFSIPYYQYIPFIVYLLNLGFTPRLQKKATERIPPSLTETCIQCNKTPTNVMCQLCERPICGKECHEIHCNEYNH